MRSGIWISPRNSNAWPNPEGSMAMKGAGHVKTQIIEKLLRSSRGYRSSSFLGRNRAVAEVARGWRKGSIISACALSICLLALVSIPVRAHVLFGSVVGAVTDTSGAVVPGAAVQIVNVQTNDHRTAQTDNSGAYTISTVPQGTYQVNVSKQGFQS